MNEQLERPMDQAAGTPAAADGRPKDNGGREDTPSAGMAGRRLPSVSACLRSLARPSRVAALLATALLWVLLLRFHFYTVGEVDLDSSWCQALGYFVTNHFQAGRDYLFTYGPFGYFTTPRYYPDLFWYHYVWDLAFSLLMASSFVRVAKYSPSRLYSLALLTLAVLFFDGGCNDSFALLSLLALGLTMVKGRDRPVSLLALDLVLLTVFALTKFTWCLYALVIVLALEGAHRVRHPRSVLSPLLLFAVIFSVLWVAIGQSLANLPSYFYGSLQIAAGYVDGMSATDLGWWEHFLALCIIVLASWGMVSLGLRRGRGGRRVIETVLLGGVLYLSWKHGFVRSDLGHTLQFFVTTLFLGGLIPICYMDGGGFRTPGAVRAGVCALGCVFLSLAGIAGMIPLEDFIWSHVEYAVDNIKAVRSPSALREDLQSQWAAMQQEWSLPQVRAYVGDAPIDMIMQEQGVLVLNRMNYRPRPVFQSYSAYTPFLLAANAHFYRLPDAPPYVLLKIASLDDRFPTLDDNQALREVLKRYRPVLWEKSYLLLERCPTVDDAGPGEVVYEKRVPFDEEITVSDLPGKYHEVAIKMAPSWAGRVRKLLYRSPEVYIKVKLSTGEDIPPYRLIPAMTETGFLLNPFVAGTNDVIGLYDPSFSTEKRITSFQITTNDKRSFQDDILVTVKTLPKVVSCPLDPAVLVKLRYPMMRTPFARVQAHEPVAIEKCDGMDVVRVHAPSEIEFDLPPRSGRHRVVGKFGILPGAYENEQDHTDGVRFTVEYAAQGSAPQVLSERFLDPHANPQDRDTQEFTAWLPPGEKGQLILRASNPPGKNEHLDWSYWTDVEIEGVKAGASGRLAVEDEDAVYRQMMQRLPGAVRGTVPAGAAVLVVGTGDDELLRQVGPGARPFMQEKDGSPAYYHPADSADAIARLEALRGKGAQFLLLPRTEFWWLDEYRGFKEHLDSHYRCLRRDDTCMIYQLSRSEQAKAEEVLPKVGGSLDVVNTDEISGWAWDSRQPDAPVQVEIYEGNTLLTKMAADQFRQDLQQAGAGNGKHGFSFPTPARLKDGKPYLIRVKIAGVEGELDGSPQKLDLLPKVGGSLEVVNTDEISGWAWDSRQPDTPVQVEIYEGGTLLTRMAADQFRQDLRDAGAGNGKHAFSFPTPARLKDGRPHLIRAKIAGVEGELDGSPKKL